MNSLLKISKFIFQCWKLVESFQKNFVEKYWTRRRTFIKKHFLRILILKLLYFLKLCPIFVGSAHNFGRSDSDILLWKNAYFHFPLVVSCPTKTKNLGRYLSQKNCRERYCRRRKQNFNIENLLFLALNLPHSCRCKAAFSKDLPAAPLRAISLLLFQVSLPTRN